MQSIPADVDLLVLGAGAGGMTAALSAAVLGLEVLVVEKAAVVGGTTARSAGAVWVPNSRHSPPGADTPAKALAYLRGTVGNRLRSEMADAYLSAAPEMVAFLEDNAQVCFRAFAHHPDYSPEVGGSTLAGRVLEVLPFDGSVLGRDFARLRAPLPEFTLFGGMMVDRIDIGHLLNAAKAAGSFAHAARLLLRYGADRLRHRRGTRLVMGNALAGRLFHALLQRGVTVLTATRALELIEEDGRVAGVTLETDGVTHTVRARRGVVLATGGFTRHAELRKSLSPALLSAHSPVIESATGDGVDLGRQAGGRLGADHANASFWAPVSTRMRRDGSTAVFPHLVLDRGKPGLIAVDAMGRRFVNEAVNYHAFVEAMYAARAVPCHLVCDDAFIVTYGLGMVRPRRMNLRRAVADGYVVRAGSITDLAHAAHIDPQGLAQSVARHNGYAATGIDLDFGKGGNAYQRNLGDAAHAPNPCLGPIATPPFYAVEVTAGDIGASCGLVTNAQAQVQRADGTPVAGLYACGNDMDSMMAGSYPGPGITIGPAMTFGYVAAKHAARAR